MSFLFTGISAGAFFWLGWPILMASRSIWARLKKKLELQKISQRFFTYGALTMLLPILLIWFLHTSWGWPF